MEQDPKPRMAKQQRFTAGTRGSRILLFRGVALILFFLLAILILAYSLYFFYIFQTYDNTTSYFPWAWQVNYTNIDPVVQLTGIGVGLALIIEVVSWTVFYISGRSLKIVPRSSSLAETEKESNTAVEQQHTTVTEREELESKPVHPEAPLEKEAQRSFGGAYFYSGLVLVGLGALLAVVSYLFAHSVPLTALGIAMGILGIAALNLPSELPLGRASLAILESAALSSEAVLEEITKRAAGNLRTLPKGGVVFNVEALTQEKDLRSGVFYLPPKDGVASVYLPLGAETDPHNLEAMWSAPNWTNGMYHENSAQTGVLLLPIGARIGEIPELQEESPLEDALQSILVDTAQLCSSLKVSTVQDIVIVEIDGVKVKSTPRLYSEILGSIPSSLAATIVATKLGRPVFMVDERTSQRRTLLRLKTE